MELRKVALPPEVTLGVELLVLGARLPVLPVEPELAVAVELWPVLLVTPEEFVVAVPALALEPPGCSCATTTPIPNVAPVATSREAFVRVRSRARARSRLAAAAVVTFWAEDISSGDLCSGVTPWDQVQFGPDAEPAVGLL